MGNTRFVAVYLLALGAALLFGVGSVVQQRVAFEAPPGKSLRPSLLLWLVRQPMWLLGVGTGVVGNLLSGYALGIGSVALVQPLLVSRLLFAIPLSAVWSKQRLAGRDWLGVLATAGGLGAFIALGHPRPGPEVGPPLWRWLVAIAAAAVAVGVLIVLSRRIRPVRAAPLLGAGAGILFGLQSGLTSTAVRHFLDGGITGLLLNWTTYVVIVTAVSGTLLAQSGYEMAPLTASYPALAAVEPLTGVGLGVGVLGGTLALGSLPLAVEVVGLAVMVVGIYLLATSRLVTAQADAIRERADTERESRIEETLTHELTKIERALDQMSGPSRRRRGVETVQGDLQRVESLLARLDELRHDVQRDRAAIREGDASDAEQAHEATLGRWEAQLDDRHRRLGERATQLRQRARALEAEA